MKPDGSVWNPNFIIVSAQFISPIKPLVCYILAIKFCGIKVTTPPLKFPYYGGGGGGELVPSEVLPKNTGFNAVFVLILSTKDGVMALEILPKKLTFQH